MAKLKSPKINVTFSELGATASARGTKGTVAIIVRDAAEVAPVTITLSSQIPAALGAENQDYIKRAFLGHVEPPKKVILYSIGEAGTLDDALAYMATQNFDYIVGPVDCTADEAAAISEWVMAQREQCGAKYKAVLPNYKADKYPIVNFTTEKIVVGKTTYPTAAYCARIAGLLVGTPLKHSATYAQLPEVTDVSRLDAEARDDAVEAGELFAFWDGRKVKLNRAVNSMTTTTTTVLDSFKKIKIVEIMDLIRTDITTAVEDGYIGKYANSYDNKLLLLTAIRNYFMALEADELVQSGYTVEIDLEAQEAYLKEQGVDTAALDEQAIKEYNTGTHVFLKVACKILDSIEDVAIPITI